MFDYLIHLHQFSIVSLTLEEENDEKLDRNYELVSSSPERNVAVQNEEDERTLFTITLPDVEEYSEQPRQRRQSAKDRITEVKTCKFFIKGICNYGAGCRNRHSY